jgi:hypothetical protein
MRSRQPAGKLTAEARFGQRKLLSNWIALGGGVSRRPLRFLACTATMPFASRFIWRGAVLRKTAA